VLIREDQERSLEPGSVKRCKSLVIEVGDPEARHYGAERHIRKRAYLERPGFGHHAFSMPLLCPAK
jgi:hypothetical protein